MQRTWHAQKEVWPTVLPFHAEFESEREPAIQAAPLSFVAPQVLTRLPVFLFLLSHLLIFMGPIFLLLSIPLSGLLTGLLSTIYYFACCLHY